MQMPNAPAVEDDSEYEMIEIQPGLHSLRSRTHRETFHPVVGPMVEAEALHVRQQRLVERALECAEPFIIWDVGLGAAANAIAALQAVHRIAAKVEIHSFDCTLGALEFAVERADQLPYVQAHQDTLATLLAAHRVDLDNVHWQVHLGDFRDFIAEHSSTIPRPHAILYDPYSPKSNPELWYLDHFRNLHAALDPNRPCLLSNYSRSTAVRVTLLLAGFHVGYGAATGEKDQTTLASNFPALLSAPLDVEWLGRVSRSVRSAPLRRETPGPTISSGDFLLLKRHAQFA
jgi:tRNA U34 5-methylaminomethyl-2-thiouridine-forming methyltransferase MnmC